MKIVETEQELRACYAVMKELRPHLASEDAFVAQMQRQYQQQYRILAVWERDAVVALAGYRYQENTVYGRFLYVDDLIAAESHRNRRWGALLLERLSEMAQQAQCARSGFGKLPLVAAGHRAITASASAGAAGIARLMGRTAAACGQRVRQRAVAAAGRRPACARTVIAGVVGPAD